MSNKKTAAKFISLLLVTGIMQANIATADNADFIGDIILKGKAGAIMSSVKQSALPANNILNLPTNPLIKNGYEIQVSTSLFFTPNIAAELFTGFTSLFVKTNTVNNIQANYGGTNLLTKRKAVYAVPLGAMLQYHIAPYGGIKPYIGAGYQFLFPLTNSKGVKIKRANGAVVQAGVDFVLTDDTMINLEIRQNFLKPKAFYTNLPNVKSKLKMNSLVVSVGFGFKL